MFIPINISHSLLLHFGKIDLDQKYKPPAFKYFRYLPLVARTEVLKFLSPVDLFNLSRTSKVFREIVKSHHPWKKLNLTLSICKNGVSFGFGGPYKVFVMKETLHSRIFYDKETFGETQKIPVLHLEHSTNTYWKDIVLGIETVGDYLLEMFEKPKVDFYVLREPMPLIEPVVDWLKRQSSVEMQNLQVEQCPKGVHELYHIVNNLTFSGSFGTSVLFEFAKIPSYLFDNVYKVTIQGRRLFLSQLNISHILKIDPKVIYWTDSNLTSGELNQFVGSWKEGKTNKKLKFFDVHSRNTLDEEEVLRGVDGKEVPRIVERTYFEFQNHIIDGGFDIERIDGTKATILVAGNTFRMVVWPDFKENLGEI